MAYTSNPEALATGLYDRGFVRFGDYTLKSGLWSPVYINLRGVGSYNRTSEIRRGRQADIRGSIVRAYSDQVEAFEHDHILGIPEAALTIAGLVAHHSNQSALQMRVKEKAHGEPVNIEGDYCEDERVVLVDDLITTGGAKIEAKEKVEVHGLKVAGIAVLVDREQGGVQQLAEAGIRTEAAIGMTTLINILAQERRIDEAQTELLRGYFAGDITERPV
ncbi:MAG: orotate phosphoribosyltransferase [Candidatus Saccharimonadales bacterium]